MMSSLPIDQARLVSSLTAEPSTTHINLAGGSSGCLLAANVAQAGTQVVYVTATDAAAERAYRDLTAFLGAEGTRLLPASDLSPFDAVRPDRRLTQGRAAALTALAGGEVRALVTSAAGWISKTTPPELLLSAATRLKVGQHANLDALCKRLERAGYERAAICEDPGDFAVRGDILDVWAPGLSRPIRADFEFDELRRLTPYDPETQRSDSSVSHQEVVLGATRESLVTPDSVQALRERVQDLCDRHHYPSSKTRALVADAESGRFLLSGMSLLPAIGRLTPLTAHLSEGALIFFEEVQSIVAKVDDLLTRAEASRALRRDEPHFETAEHLLAQEELDESIQGHGVVCLSASQTLGRASAGFSGLAQGAEKPLSLGHTSQEELSRRLTSRRQAGDATLDALLAALRHEEDEGSSCILTAKSSTQAERLGKLLAHRGLRVQLTDGPLLALLHAPDPTHIRLTVSPLARGLTSLRGGPFLLTEEEIFGEREGTPKRTAKRAIENALDDLRSLRVGDHIVHSEHGIGRYLGLEHRAVGGTTVDLIAVEYLGGDKLYLPVYRLNQVQKYSGTESSPRLDRLGGLTFAKTKSQAKKRVRIIADQLLTLYADRKNRTRTPLDEPGDEYAAFEAAFPFEETQDQAAAIADVLSDLKQPQVMDRLVCGDVGFGKTEVALRATYLNVLAGRQVALLCPTTVLSEQHYKTFQARLGASGIEVRALSRFRSKKSIADTLAGLKSGLIDVVVGTHRVLSQDVHFKNLGLLVVDEEQRFGVTHKERIKGLKKTVDVLTLSATPIPRTLSMSVSGLRDMSVISTPPVNRRAIRTFSARKDDTLIFEAITREIERGGQVFYVNNRVDELPGVAARLTALIPGLKVGIGHGQMKERELEKTMISFVAGDFDVLISTTIVESGLDIPRANTMLIERADHFGLSQLYQLRGRVGRSGARAYCYLLLSDETAITEEARARIDALERYTELGSGFHIATLDMELRGAGEFLGADQSGFMERIGFELFASLLEEATQELGGHTISPAIDPEISIDADAYLPEDFIGDVGLRLSLYKRYAKAESADEVAAIDEELEDRFGRMPQEAARFSEVMRLKTALRQLRALSLHATSKVVVLTLQSDTPLNPARTAELVQNQGYRLTPDGKLTRRLQPGERETSGLVHAETMLRELALISAPERV